MKIKHGILVLLLVIVVACDKQKPEPRHTCLDFQTITNFPQSFPGPTFTVSSVPNNSLIFINPKDPSGNSMPITLEDRVEDQDGKPELSVGFSRDTGGYQPLFVEFPAASFPDGVKDVTVELMHFASATILALDSSGKVINSATEPTQKNRTVLTLTGQNIRRLQFNVVETLVYKICWIPSPPPEVCSVCVDFESPLALNTQYGALAGHKSGDVVLTTNGIKMSVYDFNHINGNVLFDAAYIDTASALSGSGQNIRTRHINLEFDFSGVGFQISEVHFEFLDKGGIENISVNGSPIFIGEISSVTSPIGGVSIMINTSSLYNGKGEVFLKGTVTTLRIGGQEFWLDQVCAKK